MKKVLAVVAVTLLSGITGVASAAHADAAAGKAKSGMCAACHGMEGHSSIPGYPNLAGQNEQYLVTQLKAFKSGSRKNPMMNPTAAALSDADIDNLASHYSSLK